MNYFLGISATSGRLVADFEEGATGPIPGANHPLTANHGREPERLAPRRGDL